MDLLRAILPSKLTVAQKWKNITASVLLFEQIEKKIADAESWEEELNKYSDEEYEMLLLQLGADTARLKPEHFISHLFSRQNESDFEKLFDDTLRDIDFTNNFISPAFGLGNYNQTKKTFAEPQVVAPPSKIQYFDEAGLIETGSILLKEKTLIIATFEESNLNDLLCLPDAPYTYLNNDYLVNYLIAYFGL